MEFGKSPRRPHCCVRSSPDHVPALFLLFLHRNYLSKEWFLQRDTWGKSSLASQIGDVLGTSAPVNGSEKPLPTPPPSESEKAV